MSRNSAEDTVTRVMTRAEIFGTGDSSDDEDTEDKTKDTRTTQEMTMRMQGRRRGHREDAGDSNDNRELRRGEGTSLRERRGKKGTLIHCSLVAKTGKHIYLKESLRELRSKDRELRNYDEKMKS